MSAPPAGPEPAAVLHSETLDFNADCAEFCPLPGLTHLLALGTYQLLEERQERVGRAYLRALQRRREGDAGGGGGGGDCAAGQQPCGSAPLGSLDMPGIFDLKWRPSAAAGAGGGQERALLGAALADGTVRLLEVATDEARPALRQQGEVAACSSGMCLSLDWHVTAGSEDAHIATSSSAGTLSLLQVASSGMSVLSEWEAHTLEVWCAAFHKEGHVIFSGADDCYFKAYDVRTDPASAVFSDRRTHTAGVCTVSPHPTHHHIVATGSYDEHVRLWDMRNLSRPVVMSQLNTGGGNWRLRWHPHEQQVLLAACMYNGFGVLRASEDFRDLSLVCMYQSPTKHIAYGADWWQEPPAADAGAAVAAAAAAEGQGGSSSSGGAGVGRALAATCSFYDRHHTLVWLATGS